MRPLRSLRNKLALLFFAITALSFAGVVFYVVPQLQTNLEKEELRDVQAQARSSSRILGERADDSTIEQRQLNRLVRSAADASNAFVTLLAPGPAPRGLYAVSDSREGSNIGREFDPATRAVRLRKPVSEVVTVSGERFARTAIPIYSDGRLRWVALYSRSLANVTDTVSLIRNQVLVASAAALLLALVGGYIVAARLARRVRGVEGAAQQVAAGRFVDPLPVRSRDELGQLTRSFNEMQEKLQQLDRARREFIANASHELRTPIFSLAGFVELLQDEELHDETREEFLDTMSEQVERLQKLAVDLLDLSRLDAGSLEMERESSDLTQIARAVAREFRPALGHHHSRLELELPDHGVPADCDPDRVAQIMRILLDNALVHTPEGTRVTVTANHDNGAAALTVTDTGPGSGGEALDPETVDRLFERFFTADGTGGSGLGLAIARELAERMDGRITVETPPGRTVFTLVLPSGAGTA